MNNQEIYDPQVVGIATISHTAELEIYDCNDKLIIRTTTNADGIGDPPQLNKEAE